MSNFKFQTKKFKPNQKVKQIFEDSKINLNEFDPKMLWEFKNSSRPLWHDFNLITPGENLNERGYIVGEYSNDFILGTNENDTIYGMHGTDIIFGFGGNDTLRGDESAYRGSNGVDTIYGGNGRDSIWAHVGYGEAGNDRLKAPSNDGSAYLDGGDGNDNLAGGPNRDTLIGGSGRDYLAGGKGCDTMTGGEGADYFIVGQYNENNSGVSTDLITDFEDVGDKIRFELVAYNAISIEELDFNFNMAGSLIVSSNLGVLGEIKGLDPNVNLWDQVDYAGNGIKLIAEA